MNQIQFKELKRLLENCQATDMINDQTDGNCYIQPVMMFDSGTSIFLVNTKGTRLVLDKTEGKVCLITKDDVVIEEASDDQDWEKSTENVMKSAEQFTWK